MSKNEMTHKINVVSGLINEANKSGNFRKRQALENLQMKITDSYFFSVIMPQITALKAN